MSDPTRYGGPIGAFVAFCERMEADGVTPERLRYFIEHQEEIIERAKARAEQYH